MPPTPTPPLNLEPHVKAYIGDLVLAMLALRAENAALKEQLAAAQNGGPER